MTKKNSNEKKNSAVVKPLRQVVADTYALLGQTHLCHWNVRGENFFALHIAFEGQYTEIFAAVDILAERVRALGALAPGGLSQLAEMSGMKELKEDSEAKAMVKHLSDCNKKVVQSLKAARDAAADEGDKQTEDLMINRIQVHDKNVWMLDSFLA